MNDSKWKYVVSFLHYNGENWKLVSDSQYKELFLLADGFGKVTAKQATEFDIWGDWSQFRDSSDKAKKALYNKLVEWFGKPTTYVRHKNGLVWMQA